MKVRLRHPRKLLSASIGVAAVSYVACSGGCSSETVANLVAPPPADGGLDGSNNRQDAIVIQLDVVANLVALPFDATPDRVPPADGDRNGDAPSDARDSGPNVLDVVANLVIAPSDANGQ